MGKVFDNEILEMLGQLYLGMRYGYGYIGCVSMHNCPGIRVIGKKHLLLCTSHRWEVNNVG